jgi:CBS domain-containing protein
LLPVVGMDNPKRLLGVISRRDIMAALGRVVRDRNGL